MYRSAQTPGRKGGGEDAAGKGHDGPVMKEQEKGTERVGRSGTETATQINFRGE